MALSFKNYSKTGSINGTTAEEVTLLTGAEGSTIVKSLQIITGNESCYIEVIRKTGDNSSPYATIKLELKANDYLLLWQGFFIIPKNHLLTFKTDSNKCTVVANVVEMT